MGFEEMTSKTPPVTDREVPRNVQSEREAILSAISSIIPMLGAMIGDHVEIVLHDITRPEISVLQVANGHVTGRKSGDSLLAGPQNDHGLVATARGLIDTATAPDHVSMFPYSTTTRDGRMLTSGSVIFRDSSGQPFAALCVNADMHDIETVHALLSRMLSTGNGNNPEQRPNTSPPDIESLIDNIICQAIHRYRKPVVQMTKEEKTTAVALMQDRGLFIVKGGVDKAASALGVTRFTIYNYLDELKSNIAD
ncbi:helix-turn-helix transcriptional regulator [Burkholderia sola]|uniref:helix-turn-helix transcriptional regulator n=1 Tax=Burkholderia sola TaxID=2843302 RepID=UPI0023DE0EC3|nr:PAS domain-containing protein [Burkholderia sola]